MAAESGELVAEGSKGAALVVMLLYVLRWMLPNDWHFRWIRLYAEKEESDRKELEEAEDETQ